MNSFFRQILSFSALFSIQCCPGASGNANDDHVQSRPAALGAAGLSWETSFTGAVARAKRNHKPILHLQLFGKLNDALC